jgi:DNA repair ATPase RecN
MAETVRENTDTTPGLNKILAALKEQLAQLEAVRKNDKLWGKIDYINLQVEQTKEINEKYNKLLAKDPNTFETVYHAIAILSRNTDVFNDKVEVLETFIDEMDKKIFILRDVLLKTLALVEKLPAYLEHRSKQTASVTERSVS